MSMARDRSCPQCGNYNIANVRALYDKGKEQDGSALSATTKQFAPPPRPNTDIESRYDGYAAELIALLIAVLGSLALAFLLGWENIEQTYVILSLAGIALAAFIIHRRDASVTKKLPHWEQALQRWDEMSYCSTCNVVFMPSERRPVPLAQQHALAYENTPFATLPANIIVSK